MSAGNEGNEGQRVLRVNVPGLDADRLEATVAATRAAFAFASRAATRSVRSLDDHVLQAAFSDIEARLDLADERSLPRTQIPARFRRFRRLLALVLRPYNYLMKPQREAALEQTQALRAMLAVLRAMASDIRDET